MSFMILLIDFSVWSLLKYIYWHYFVLLDFNYCCFILKLCNYTKNIIYKHCVNYTKLNKIKNKALVECTPP